MTTKPPVKDVIAAIQKNLKETNDLVHDLFFYPYKGNHRAALEDAIRKIGAAQSIMRVFEMRYDAAEVIGRPVEEYEDHDSMKSINAAILQGMKEGKI